MQAKIGVLAATVFLAACSSGDTSGLFGRDDTADGGSEPANGNGNGNGNTTSSGGAAGPGEPGVEDSGAVPQRDAAHDALDGNVDDVDAHDASDDRDDDAGQDANAPDTGSDAGIVDAGHDAADCGSYAIFSSSSGPYCPYTSQGAVSCAVGQHCCEYVQGNGIPSTCNDGATACQGDLTGGADWECDEQNDCPGSSYVCCLHGSVTQQDTCPTRYTGVGVTGTTCRPSACDVGEIEICGDPAHVGNTCTQGTCTGMNTHSKNLGFCKI